jgi:ArsR family transcriptional regulator, arsenate/arsenite/antimonite-responsive transcriptional repressor
MFINVLDGEFAPDIDICQYRPMSKSVLELTPVQSVACCSPLVEEPIAADRAERIAPLLKAIADPVRLRLLSLVASHADGEACVCDLNDAFDLSQPTISHHLKVLHDVGLLDRSKRGVWVYYRIRTDALADVAKLLGGVAR